MYTGSYSASTKMSGITILSALAMIMACATLLILPIVMALKFNCKRKKLIILLHIALFFIIGPLNSIISFILVAVDKKNSKYYADDIYKDTVKNIVWFHIILYSLNILTLFTTMAKVRYLDKLEINGITKFNLSFFLGKKDDLIGNLISKDDYNIVLTVIWIFIIASLIGLVVNLIFRDARKPLLLMFNAIIQGINTCIIFMFAGSFDNSITKPGVAFLWESMISIVFVTSLYVAVHKTSYIDN